jgi:hypothetical protein
MSRHLSQLGFATLRKGVPNIVEFLNSHDHLRRVWAQIIKEVLHIEKSCTCQSTHSIICFIDLPSHAQDEHVSETDLTFEKVIALARIGVRMTLS